jgi:L-lactate permease
MVANPVTWLVVALLGLIAASAAVVYAAAGTPRFFVECLGTECGHGTNVLRGDVIVFVAGVGLCAAGLVGYVVARTALLAAGRSSRD